MRACLADDCCENLKGGVHQCRKQQQFLHLNFRCAARCSALQRSDRVLANLPITLCVWEDWFAAVLDCFKTAGIPRKWLQRNLVTMASQAVPAFIRQDSIRVLRAGEKVSASRKRHDHKYLKTSTRYQFIVMHARCDVIE